MAKPNRRSSPAAPVTESLPPDAVPAVPKVDPLFLADHMSSARASTHAEMVLRDAVEHEFRRVHEMLKEFVEGELAKGYSIEEVLGLYELVTCLVPTVTYEGDRPRVRMTAEIVEIVEKVAEGDGDE